MTTGASELRLQQSSSGRARTVWFIAVAIGLIYWLGALGRADIAFQWLADLPKWIVVVVKCLATGGLVVAAFLAAKSGAKRALAGAIAIVWLADLALALGQAQTSGYVFVVAHVIAMFAFARMTKRTSGKAVAVLPGGVALCGAIAGAIAAHRLGAGWLMAAFPLFSATASLVAGRTVLPLVLVAGGYAVFSVSDVVAVLSIAARHTAEWGWLSWLTYFGGLSMIVRGLIEDTAVRAS